MSWSGRQRVDRPRRARAPGWPAGTPAPTSRSAATPRRRPRSAPGRSPPTRSGAARTAAAARRSSPRGRARGRGRRAGGRTRRPAGCARTAACRCRTRPRTCRRCPATVNSVVCGSTPSVAKWNLTDSQAPRAVIAHLLVVVALGPAGGERVAEPVPVGLGDLVGRVGERGGALVRGHHQVGVVAVVPDHAGRRHHLAVAQVVGHVQHGGDEGLVAGEHLGLVGLAVGRVRQVLADEPALGPGRDDDRVLDLLGLGQPEDLGAEVLPPVRPAQPATGHRPRTAGARPPAAASTRTPRTAAAGRAVPARRPASSLITRYGVSPMAAGGTGEGVSRK